MASIHIATKTVVKVSIGSPSGNSVAVFVQRGGIVPEGVDKEQLKRLVRQGFIEAVDVPDPEPEPTVFTQADVDAAVRAAEKAKDAELASARALVEEEARKVAEARAAAPADVTLADGSKPPTGEDGLQILHDATPVEAPKQSAAKPAAKRS